ncbi:ATP synthase subunit b [Petrocella atlantisensis]|uniref:ATP synthase subunit b n=1 Tax=Petrocella atlantisensis TaxID=2173034 RepID=A0A3P7NXB5_9FIRM|nr:F0F1 ATP synthase subunit B [Petrocella atlantisensis]MCF8019635.1 F0F1 ATP synthase subunit B [Vallitaleaceae bacterium]VDN47874.1 ATP synthase subunit b [Petrocella atlantisensis]
MNGLNMVMQNLSTSLPQLNALPEPYVIFFTEQTIIQVIAHILTVLALFYVLGKLLFKPVRNILQKRKDEIADEYKRIDEDTEALAALKTDYENKLLNIHQEAEKILAHARKRAIEREDEIIKEAKDEADRLIKRAHLDIEREKEQSKDEMRREIIGVATVMASKFVAASISDELKNQLVDETLASIGESSWLS